MFSRYSRCPYPYQYNYRNDYKNYNNYNMNNSNYFNCYNYESRYPTDYNYNNNYRLTSTSYNDANQYYNYRNNINIPRRTSQDNYLRRSNVSIPQYSNRYNHQEESKYLYENKTNYNPYTGSNNFQNHNTRKYSTDYNRRYIQNGNNKNKEINPKETKKEKPKSNTELTLEYENRLHEEIKLKSPLVSELLDIKILLEDYKSNEEYSNSIKTITEKYHNMRKICRDGNCFYRSFIFRLFEYICTNIDEKLYNQTKQKIIESKNLTEKNGYEWQVVKDFYEIFLNEFNNCFNIAKNKRNINEKLNKLFNDKDKGNYMIYFIRFCISAYLKENSTTYNVYVEGNFDEWIRNEVEAIDHEADQIQIMACVNYFGVGVKIDYLNKNKNEVIKLPEDKAEEEFFIFLLFTPGHYELLYP